MIGDHDDLDEVAELDEQEDPNEVADFDDKESAADPDAPTANVGETSVEFNVEDLIAELEADSGVSSGSSETDPRKRLEKILEERRAARELEALDEFTLDSPD